jgi:hypothetical protein
MRVFVGVALVLSVTACGGGGSAPGGSPAIEPGSPAPSAALTGPGAKIEVGAWAHPSGSTGTSSQDIAALENQIGRHFDISLHYDAWAAPFPSPGERIDRSVGRTPEVSWNCGGSNAAVAAGQYDAVITAKATQMAAYGAPILLRYLWEFNLPSSANNRTACIDPARDLGGYFNPGDFVAAWLRIHGIFAAAGATNVQFVWNPNSSTTRSAAQFWPGDATVDWVGIDAYDHGGAGLAATLAPGYAAYANLGTGSHPVIVGETGAGTGQATYLDGASRAMLAAQFPKIRALSYFDAIGPAGNWSFTAPGLAAFKIFATQ